MSYKRKTKDEWQLLIAYHSYNKIGFEWEEVCAYDNRKEAREDFKAYIVNDKNILDMKIKKVRIKN